MKEKYYFSTDWLRHGICYLKPLRENYLEDNASEEFDKFCKTVSDKIYNADDFFFLSQKTLAKYKENSSNDIEELKERLAVKPVVMQVLFIN